jgi:hypothetical protein
MNTQKIKITVLFGSWIKLNKNYTDFKDYIDINIEELICLDKLFIGLQPGDRFDPFYSYLKSILSNDESKVFITSIPDFTDFIKEFCDFNKISYKFLFFNFDENSKKMKIEDLGESISKIFKVSNTEWQLANEKFYQGENN